MFKSLTNYLKSDMCKWICVAVVVAIVAYSLMNYSSAKGLVLDAMSTSVQANDESTMVAGVQAAQPANYGDTEPSIAASTGGNSDYTKIDTNSPSDLLPHDNNAGFANLTSGNTDLPDLMAAGAAIGIDTIGQSLRNANLQLRSDPTIPVKPTGPWSQSTMEPDLGRVPLELGCETR